MNEVSELVESVELEARSDLMAAAGDFGQACLYMKAANKIRAQHFGKLDPNELRERTLTAISAIHGE